MAGQTGRPQPQGPTVVSVASPSPSARARRAGIDDPEVVLAAGLRFLEARSRSVEEVRRRLARRATAPSSSRRPSTGSLAIGLLDDELFARGWIESRDRARPRGELALRRELSQRGRRPNRDRCRPRRAPRRRPRNGPGPGSSPGRRRLTTRRRPTKPPLGA